MDFKAKKRQEKITHKVEDAKPVTVKTHLIKLPLYAGTHDSCKFHYNLYLSYDTGIFATETIKTFVEFKAVQNLLYFWIYATPYILFMIGMILGTVFEIK